MQHGSLVRVADTVTDFAEERDPSGNVETMPVAVPV